MAKFALTKTESADLKKHIEALTVADNRLIEALDVYNAAVRDAYAKLAERIEEFNGHAQAAKSFCEDIANERREEFDNRSDKWRESDAGSEAEAWISEWEGIELDDVSVDEPEDITIETTHVANLEALPEEPS